MDNLNKPPAIFALGQVVQRPQQPEALGIVREARWDDQVESWNYLVQFGAQLKVLPEEALQLVVPITSVWDALRASQYAGVKHFSFSLTLQRLLHPPSRIAHSFATSRTQFYPHQFKPLLKFLDHPGKRLLIADDVGLGKTIEAGYILRELEAQQVVERVLVLVPARLTSKWKRELQSRFDESFEIVKAADILKMADRLRQGREPEPFRWIVSYESARLDEVRKALEETQPAIDVLIADEAHRMRNPESLQHRVGAVLCAADTVIFLSATPVQNKLDDLWHLLRLLSPDEFGDWSVFQRQLDANRPLLAAQRALSQRPISTEEAQEALAQFYESEPGRLLRGTAMARSIDDRLGQESLERRDVVELQADIARMSPTGHVLSRTRKVEALPNRPVRVATWCPVRLTEEERKIYDSVEHLCQMSWPGAENSWGSQMSLLMAYRITASCIPAAIDYFADKLHTTPAALPVGGSDADKGDEIDDADPALATSAWSGPPRQRLAEAVGWYERLAGRDTKLKCLVDELRLVWAEDDRGGRARRKVVVFSYFRRTLDYLARALCEREISNRMIHGGVAVDDREVAIDEFLERAEVLVLLTSDVGGEGIDLQRASVLVNYDLPWNPMVVEQRIGRIDRIGQETPRIVVRNLVVTESVEERVLQRLLDKIGIFTESIGELDPIIGEEIEQLASQALRGQLADEELIRTVDERGDALARRVLDARNMLSRVDGLLAADQGLIDEINAVTGERQIPSEGDILLFLNAFLAERFPGCQLPQSVARDVVAVDLRGHLAAAMERESPSVGVEFGLFARRIAGGPVSITLSRDAAYRHPRAELVHLRHPLVRFTVAQLDRAKERPKTAFALRLPDSAILPDGLYAFLISVVELKGHRTTVRFASAVMALTAGERVWSDPDQTTRVVLDLLERGQDIDDLRVDPVVVERAQSTLVSTVRRLISDWNTREQELDLARRQQRHAALQSTLALRVQRARERLETLEQKTTAEFPIRMARKKLENAEREFEGIATSPPRTAWSGVEEEEVAVGVLRVGKE